MSDFNKYKGMSDNSFKPAKPTIAPEDEFLHNIYITVRPREGESVGKLQVRGVMSNVESLHMIILKTKVVMAKEVETASGNRTECFSYREGNVWTGTSKDDSGRLRVCGKKANDRALVDFCKNCKSHYVISGLLVDETGKRILDAKGNNTFVFIRAKGVKYGPASDYVYSLSNRNFDTKIFNEPDAEAFEREVVNPMRVITKVEVGTVKSAYGDQLCFKMEAGRIIPDTYVIKFLDMANEVLLPEFIKKIDWSKGGDLSQASNMESATLNTFEDDNQASTQTSNNTNESFNFDDNSSFKLDDFSM